MRIKNASRGGSKKREETFKNAKTAKKRNAQSAYLGLKYVNILLVN